MKRDNPTNFFCIISGKTKSLIRQSESYYFWVLLLLQREHAVKNMTHLKISVIHAKFMWSRPWQSLHNLHTYLYKIMWNCDRFGPPTIFLVSLFLFYSVSILVETFKVKSEKLMLNERMTSCEIIVDFT